ncbi:peroxisomal membrane protein 11C-like [Gigantopelta aegis]|uniref:peroxisomal membrane protein 11C-like n=1 Tax=Gigantopelta aegis TaxID=1735272 RepID=UPI001B88DBBE|nr:peroxisomal membrane protein 11C-like [Gigantopelta aegis]
MDIATQVVKLMETYRGRDKVLRILTYTSMFLAGQRTSPSAQKLRILTKELSGCRATLRLFDDLSMLLNNLKYGIGEQEHNISLRLLDLSSNMANQLYYIVEHIAWFADKQIVSRSSSVWWIACIAIWFISLTLEIIKSIIRLYMNRKAQQKLARQKVLDSQESGLERTEQNQEIANRLKKLKQEEVGLFLVLLHSTVDLLNAGNWLPKGVLWSGCFSPTKSGLFGMVSSVILLYKIWPSREKKLL